MSSGDCYGRSSCVSGKGVRLRVGGSVAVEVAVVVFMEARENVIMAIEEGGWGIAEANHGWRQWTSQTITLRRPDSEQNFRNK